MEETNSLFQIFIYLGAAVITVPLAKKMGLGAVIGYLIAGILIGPFIFNLVGNTQDVKHFAEFGVIILLFLIGLELKPSRLWNLRVSILGIGGLQLLITTAVIMLISMLFVNLSWQQSLVIGLALSLSSTAIVIQTLTERGIMKTKAGQNAFAVILLQDIAVIPIFAIIPLLGAGDVAAASAGTWVDGMPIYLKTLVVLGAMLGIILGGKYLQAPLFKIIAKTKLLELFTAASLLIIIGITLLMKQIGLSPALGTFIAGVVLAQSEYRHELETNLLPFKGLLLGLFFISVGASLNFKIIINNPLLILSITFGFIILKFIISFLIGKVFKMKFDNNMNFALSLAQGGGFGFLICSYAVRYGVFPEAIANPVVAAIAISMALTPLLMIINIKFIEPRFGTKQQIVEQKADDSNIEDDNEIIIAGFGKYGSMVGRFLQANGVGATYLDTDPNNVELLRKIGFKVFYGDASRKELLLNAGVSDAKMLIVAVNNPEISQKIVDNAKKNFPHLKIFARANTWQSYYEMNKRNVDGVYREYVDSALNMAAETLYEVGFRKHQTQRALVKFKQHDEEFMQGLAHMHQNDNNFVQLYKQKINDLEKIMLNDMQDSHKVSEKGWNEIIEKRKKN